MDGIYGYPILGNTTSEIISLVLGYVICMLIVPFMVAMRFLRYGLSALILWIGTILGYIISITNAIFQYFYFPEDIYAYLDLIRGQITRENIGFGYYFYAKLFMPLDILGIANYFIVSAINIVLKLFTIIFLIKFYLGYVYGNNYSGSFAKNYYFWASLLIMVYPAFSYYTVLPLRESLVFFFTSYALYLYVSTEFGYSAYAKTLAYLGAVAATALLRPYYAIVFLIPLLLKFLKRRGILTSICMIAFSFIVLFFVVPQILNLIGLDSIATYLKLSHIEEARNYRVKTYEDGYKIVNLTTIQGFISSVAYLFFGFILTPLITTDNPMNYSFGLLDLLFIIPVIILSTLHFKLKDDFTPQRRNIYLFSFITILAMGLIEYTVGGAIRHRMMSVLLLVLICTDLIAHKITNHKVG